VSGLSVLFVVGVGDAVLAVEVLVSDCRMDMTVEVGMEILLDDDDDGSWMLRGVESVLVLEFGCVVGVVLGWDTVVDCDCG